MKPYKHQQEQRDWIRSRGYGFINGDMGTGKTGAALLATHDCRRVLVCCPIAVGPAWVKQIGLWDKDRESCLVVEGTAARRARSVTEASKTRKRLAVITNYDAVWRGDLSKAISKIKWDAIVLDESHLIKSPSGKRSRWLAKFAEKQPQAKRICMTGTPCPHSPLDWWSQFRFLDPAVLGSSYTAYRARIANIHPMYPSWIKSFKPDAIEALSKRLDPHVYRVTAEQVLTLPDAIHTDIAVSLSPRARKYYEQIEEDMIATLETGETVSAANKLVVVSKLQQATSGFAKTSEGQLVPIDPDCNPKVNALREWLECLPQTEPVVVFCKFIADIEACTQVAIDTGRTVSELSGRKKMLDAWQRGDTTVLVVQQQAGGVGVDMTRACYAAYFSLSHSLGDYEQSLARLRRPGQTRPCRFYHFVADRTVDETIYAALQNKKDVADAVYSRLTRRVECSQVRTR